MPQIYTAFASEAKVNGETVEGLQSIEYRQSQNRHDIGAIGTDERVAVYFGLKSVTGQLQVASASTALDGILQSKAEFSISVTLKHGETSRNVTFDGCYMENKEFALGAETHGVSVYAFTATRVREE